MAAGEVVCCQAIQLCEATNPHYRMLTTYVIQSSCEPVRRLKLAIQLSQRKEKIF